VFVKRLVGAAVAAALAIPLSLGGAAPAQAAPTSVYGIYNPASIGIGVLQNWRTSGANYDRILPSGSWTNYDLGWGHAGGVYIGSGYCARRYTSVTGNTGTWRSAGSDFEGPNRFRLAGNYYVQIDPYRC